MLSLSNHSRLKPHRDSTDIIFCLIQLCKHADKAQQTDQGCVRAMRSEEAKGMSYLDHYWLTTISPDSYTKEKAYFNEVCSVIKNARNAHCA